jgi:hypothetical protein
MFGVFFELGGFFFLVSAFLILSIKFINKSPYLIEILLKRKTS